MVLADGRTFYPGQGNNAYVFPGVALGVIACGVRHISDDVFLTSAEVRRGNGAEFCRSAAPRRVGFLIVLMPTPMLCLCLRP